MRIPISDSKQQGASARECGKHLTKGLLPERAKAKRSRTWRRNTMFTAYSFRFLKTFYETFQGGGYSRVSFPAPFQRTTQEQIKTVMKGNAYRFVSQSISVGSKQSRLCPEEGPGYSIPCSCGLLLQFIFQCRDLRDREESLHSHLRNWYCEGRADLQAGRSVQGSARPPPPRRHLLS